MLNSACECWIPAVTSAVTLVLHALLLLALYIMLSRKIAQHSRGMQSSSSPGEHPSPHPAPAPAPSPGGDKAQQPGAQQPGAQNPAPACAGSSDTSSETSEDSDSSSCPQGPGSEENINYTSLVFVGKGQEPGSAQDYENMKTGMDYVNVDPKKRKILFWPFSSPRASKGVEYTEVKL
ncbi:regulator of hemoglobinization and erythroid cell expansion protein [Corvus cornix cornix]|nr:regulator of hemoglobinization and erythroid cell expansion protein [Corvus cornix cornix]